MNPAIAIAIGGGGVVNTYTDDVFSTYLYGGNGTSQSINNGIDLAGKGGMVWFKCRNSAIDVSVHDTVRGSSKLLASNTTAAEATSGQYITAFNNNGFSLGTGNPNTNALNFASYTFRKAAKFFDVVTWTGDGASSKQIAHNLGGTIGAVIVKRTDTTSDWPTWVRNSLGNYSSFTSGGRGLNSSSAALNTNESGYNSAFTSSTLNVGTGGNVGIGALGDCNTSGGSYVAYLFADDSSASSIIRCGSFTTDASGNATVTDPNWEPQSLIVKAASASGDWVMLDAVRGWSLSAEDRSALVNSTAAESTATDYGNPTATGFVFKGAASTTYIYLAIRRPNKPPTTGTKVLSIDAALSQAAVAGLNIYNGSPNPQDLLVMFGDRTTPTTPAWLWADRSRGYASAANGSPILDSTSTAAQSARTTSPYIYHADATGYINFVPSTNSMVYRFARAAGVFDIVSYKGTGGASQSVTHNLSGTPELIITKRTDAASPSNGWAVYSGTVDQICWLNSTLQRQAFANTYPSAPTTTTFTVGSNGDVGASGGSYVSYLFKTLAGISKVGSYTGNGGTQNIDCGFTAGARFVLIKRVNSTGDWYVWDTVRGIVAGNDPHLSFNSTAAEVTTDDSIDPLSSGFAVNQLAATNINVNAATYIYLAIA